MEIVREWIAKNPVGTVMVPGVQEIPNTTWPWLEWIRDNITKRAFVFFHRFTGNWVLAAWVFAPGEHDVAICKELHTFRASPREEWPSDLVPPNVLLLHREPFDDVYANMLRQDRERKWEEAEERRRVEEEQASMEKHLRKMGLAAAAMPHTMANWRPRDEFSDQIADLLLGRG